MHRFPISSTLVICAALAASLSSCASSRSGMTGQTVYLNGMVQPTLNSQAAVDQTSYWEGDNVQGPPSVVINLTEQRANFYKGQTLVGVSAISSGKEGHDTPSGSYKIMQKNANHKSNLYGSIKEIGTGRIVNDNAEAGRTPVPAGCYYDPAPMPWFMRITGGVGMHEGFLPGYAASHGCIRMPGYMAQTFFNNVSVGTPVQIIR